MRERRLLRNHPLLLVLFGLSAILAAAPSARAAVPANFVEEPVGTSWSEVTGITFAADGTMFAWERAGRVWMLHDDEWFNVLDIRQEVGGWRDYGLLGFAIDRDFLTNGRVYLMYVVDRHHLLNFGTPSYNPNSNAYYNATIGRITRYTLDVDNDFHTVVPGSRFILLGETKSTGVAILHESHGIGSLVFGSDGTLLASTGDGASYNAVDTGGGTGGAYASQGLTDGIITAKENVGAFRSQLVDGLNGKILRLDPETGNGVESNPFYSAASPRSAKSRMWALGLRNPCRMSLRPGTGSFDPLAADPGSLYIGDVGWGTWEELDVCDGAAQNFGWPLFEGMTTHTGYWAANVVNRDAPNPLAGGACATYFRFRDLIVQDSTNPDPAFPNPCDTDEEVPASIPTFKHRRPSIDWGRPNGPARTGVYTSGTAAVVNVGAGGSPVTGSQFGGNCSIGGVWYTGSLYPVQYQNTYFHADFGGFWVRSFAFNDTDRPTHAQSFMTGTSDLVGMAVNPVDGNIYFARWNSIFRLRYLPTGNQPPIAAASANVSYGPSPLAVQFNDAASIDPNNHALQYFWEFGDGQTSTQRDPQHTYFVSGGDPARFDVTLTVTDPGNLTAQDSLIVSVNNSPPVVSLVSPVQGSTYNLTGQTTYSLVASVIDAEQGATDRSCEWMTALHHNTHNHPEPLDYNCVTTTVISPVGCDADDYFYRVHITVTDDAGLSGSDTVDIYPNCDGNQPPTANGDSGSGLRGESAFINVLANDVDADGTLRPDRIAMIEQPVNGTLEIDAATGIIVYTHDGSDTDHDNFAYTVNDNEGGTSNIASVYVTVFEPFTGDVNSDNVVNEQDMLAVLMSWGQCPAAPAACPADLAPPVRDGVVDEQDLMMVISNWG